MEGEVAKLRRRQVGAVGRYFSYHLGGIVSSVKKDKAEWRREVEGETGLKQQGPSS